MTPRVEPGRDPIAWCWAVTLAFSVLAIWRLGIPSKTYFDEIHYVTAARKLLVLDPFNREHPMVAKEAIAGMIRLFGDRPFVWRIPSFLAGMVGLFAFSRLVWLTSCRSRATVAATVLLATNFMWFELSRIAMLDMVSAGLCMVALWQFAAAVRGPAARARWHLLACSVAMGLSFGAKWSVAPALAVPAIAFIALRVRDTGWRVAGRRGAGPVPGVSLAEAAVWLGLLPLAIYWATFLPEMHYAVRPTAPFGFIAQHEYMLRLQDSVVKPHPYQSHWYQWLADWRPIWFLYEKVDGAQRGVLMLGNPFTMWVGLLSLPWALWAVVRRRRGDVLGFLAVFLACIAMWALDGKPVQFYYHYLMPGACLAALFALMLDALGEGGGRRRWLLPAALVAATLTFAWFFPIISSLPLAGKRSFEFWMWLHSWR